MRWLKSSEVNCKEPVFTQLCTVSAIKTEKIRSARASSATNLTSHQANNMSSCETVVINAQVNSVKVKPLVESIKSPECHCEKKTQIFKVNSKGNRKPVGCHEQQKTEMRSR